MRDMGLSDQEIAERYAEALADVLRSGEPVEGWEEVDDDAAVD